MLDMLRRGFTDTVEAAGNAVAAAGNAITYPITYRGVTHENIIDTLLTKAKGGESDSQIIEYFHGFLTYHYSDATEEKPRSLCQIIDTIIARTGQAEGNISSELQVSLFNVLMPFCKHEHLLNVYFQKTCVKILLNIFKGTALEYSPLPSKTHLKLIPRGLSPEKIVLHMISMSAALEATEGGAQQQLTGIKREYIINSLKLFLVIIDRDFKHGIKTPTPWLKDLLDFLVTIYENPVLNNSAARKKGDFITEEEQRDIEATNATRKIVAEECIKILLTKLPDSCKVEESVFKEINQHPILKQNFSNQLIIFCGKVFAPEALKEERMEKLRAQEKRQRQQPGSEEDEEEDERKEAYPASDFADASAALHAGGVSAAHAGALSQVKQSPM